MRTITFAAGLLTLGLALAAHAQEAAPSSTRPPVEFVLAPGEASAVPVKKNVSWANGGIVDVARPDPTTLTVTMSGITATNADLICSSAAHYRFDLTQAFAVCFNSPRVVGAKLTLEGRVIGLLRTNHEPYAHHCKHCCGVAETEPACAAVTCDAGEVATLTLPGRAASGCEDLSVYNHDGPVCVPVGNGHYVLHETWGFGTTHPPFVCRGASAEFAPQPFYYPGPGSYWFQHFQPFNGVATKDFGFQVTLKLIPEYRTAKDKGGQEMAPVPDDDQEGREKMKNGAKSTKEKPEK